ncbi:hypothetical protein FF1_034594 [Malus domestica]
MADEPSGFKAGPKPYRPNRPSSSTNIPIIDQFRFDLTRCDSVQASIGQTCRDWGAFHVTDHSLPAALLDAIKRADLIFFNDSSVTDKLNYACDPSSSASEKLSTHLEKPWTLILSFLLAKLIAIVISFKEDNLSLARARTATPADTNPPSPPKPEPYDDPPHSIDLSSAVIEAESVAIEHGSIKNESIEGDSDDGWEGMESA